MSDLISKQALLDDIRKKAKAGFPANKNLSLYAESCVIHAPTVDAVSVVHGKWEFEHMTGDRSYYAHCSECGKRKFFKDYDEQDNYCPNCGADMRELPEPPEEDEHA